jgi:hypothetical protein
LIPELRRRFATVEHHDLTTDSALWGRRVDDERYAVVAHHDVGVHISRV